MRSHWSGLVVVVLAAQVAVGQGNNSFAGAVRDQLGPSAVEADSTERLVEYAALQRLYQSASARPLWIDADGPTPQALATIEALASSYARGLPGARYDIVSVRSLAADAAGSPTDAARFDVALSRAAIRFLADLHMGRVDPGTIGVGLPDAHAHLDLAAAVTAVAQSPDVPAAIGRMEPMYVEYRALEQALARYRALAADSTLHSLRRPGATVHPGEPYHDVRALARLLTALGDLSRNGVDSAGLPSEVSTMFYSGDLVDAVTRFQRRHGLDPDGALGPATMAQLRVPLANRVRQIELALERWRWLPDATRGRFVVVSIPGFQLHAYDDDTLLLRRPRLSLRVIVGEARGRHNTPSFAATMREVVFRPYWDVPPQIARTELIPLFRRRPGYFDGEGFEIVRRGIGDAGAETFAPTPENLARVSRGELRLRQRPGLANALGLVKFLFPNRYNVYVHDTPTKDLFARSRRDFSHGCIRAQDPTDLAELLLRGQPRWDRETIDAAMNGSSTVHVALERPLPVYVIDATASVDAAGVVSFFPDLYGRDATLDQTLRRQIESSSLPVTR